MDPVTIIAATNAALALAETLIPKVRELAQRGEITAEQQAETLRRYQSLKARAEGQFTGDHWTPSRD